MADNATDNCIIKRASDSQTDKKGDISITQTTADKAVDISIPKIPTENEADIDIFLSKTTIDKALNISISKTSTENDAGIPIPKTSTDNESYITIPQTSTDNERDIFVPKTSTDNEVDISISRTSTNNEADIFAHNTSTDNETDIFIPETTAAPPSFDDVLRRLGNPGRFQLIQIALLLSAQIVMASVSMSFVFIGFEPPHMCHAVNETSLLAEHGLLNDSSAFVSYRSCDLVISTNQTGRETDVITTSCPSGRNFSHHKHTTWLSHWDLVCESRGLGELTYSGYNAGMIVGGLLASSLADRYGRRIVFLACYFCLFCTESSIIFAPNIYLIIVVRIFSGVFRSGFASTFYVMCIELIIPGHREFCGTVMCTIWIFQMMAVGAVAYVFQDSDWRYLQGAVAVSALPSLVYPFFITESPRWLTTKKRYGDALTVLRRACRQSGKNFNEVRSVYLLCVGGKNDGEDEEEKCNDKESSKKMELRLNAENDDKFSIKDFSEEVELKCRDGAVHQSDLSTHIKDKKTAADDALCSEYQDDLSAKVSDKRINRNANDASFLTLLCHKDLLLITLSATFVTFANNITYHGLYMTSSSLVGNRFLNYSIMCLLEFPSTALMYLMMRKMGRLHVLRFFLWLTWMALLVSTLLMNFAQDTSVTKVCVAVMFMLGMFAIASSYSIAIIMRPEIFPTNLRSSGGAFVGCVSRLGTMLVPYMRTFMTILKWGPAVIFTAVSAIALALTFFIPETKDKELLDSVSDLRKSMKEKKERE